VHQSREQYTQILTVFYEKNLEENAVHNKPNFNALEGIIVMKKANDSSIQNSKKGV
jgi:hypothetical protein